MELTTEESQTVDSIIKDCANQPSFKGGIAEFMNHLANKYNGQIPSKVIMRLDNSNGLAVNLDEVIEFLNKPNINNGTAN